MCWPSTDFWIPRSFEKGIPPQSLPVSNLPLLSLMNLSLIKKAEINVPGSLSMAETHREGTLHGRIGKII